MVFNNPPVLLNATIDLNLPCTESEWNAATPDAWNQFRGIYAKPITFEKMLQSLSAKEQQPAISCSAFGMHIMLHAILQHLFLIRQVTLSGTDSSDILMFETLLERWTEAWESNAESSLCPRNPYVAIASSSCALLRLAYIQLASDFSRIATAFMSQDASITSQAMMRHTGNIVRSLCSTKAALNAVHALSTLFKLRTTSRDVSLGWALEHQLYSLDYCTFLRKTSPLP